MKFNTVEKCFITESTEQNATLNITLFYQAFLYVLVVYHKQGMITLQFVP